MDLTFGELIWGTITILGGICDLYCFHIDSFEGIIMFTLVTLFALHLYLLSNVEIINIKE